MNKTPSILDRFLSKFGYIKPKAVSLSTSQTFGMDEYPLSKTNDFIRSYTGWVYACVKARSQDVSKIKLKLFKVKDRKTGEVEEVLEHDVLSLIRSVNSFTTTKDLFKATQAYKDLAGEAFWLLIRGRDMMASTGIITQIWILRPDYVDVVTDANGFVAGYKYRVPGGEPLRFSKEQIIHFKEFNPVNPFRGLSVIQAGAVTIDTDSFAEKYNKNFFKNSAIPSFMLTTEGSLTPIQINRMRAQWDNEFKGTDKAHKMAILEGGLKIDKFSISHKDLEFLNGQGFTRDKIFGLFEVPKVRLGLTENVTVSNADATEKIYLKYVVSELMESIKDTLNEFLLPLYNNSEDLFFEFVSPVPENLDMKIKEHEHLFKFGAATPNELRIAHGKDEVAGLDNFYLPLNLQPISSEDGSGEKIIIGTISKKLIKDIPPKRLKEKIADEIAKDITNEITKTLAKEFSIKKKVNKENEKPEGTRMSEEQANALWKQLVEISESAEDRFIKDLRAYFNRQEKDILDKLKDVEGKGVIKLASSDVGKVLFDLTKENGIAVTILVPQLINVFEKLGQETLDILLDTLKDFEGFDATSESARQFTMDSALRGIKNLNRVTRLKLKKKLQEAIIEGLSPQQTAKVIKGVFVEADTVRALKIARTELLKAGNRGTLEAYKQSGVVVGKEWFTSLDERVCQWCGPLHGKTVSLDQTYFDKDTSFLGNKGGTLNFKLEDVPTPPLHPNCRCTILPLTISQRMAKPKKEKSKVEYVIPYKSEDPKVKKEEVKKILNEILDEDFKTDIETE